MLWFAVGLVALVAIGGVVARWWMGRAMFVPGTVAATIAGRGEALEPPAGQAPNAAEWNVAPGIRLRHTVVGSGREVVVVHGGPGFPPAAPWRAAELTADALRWHFYDQRGCGGSTRPILKPPQGGTWAAMQEVEGKLGMAEQLADLERIRQILGTPRMTLVGHSFGALYAALYAAEWPDRVESLVLVAPAPLVTMPVEDGDLFALVRKRLDAGMQQDFDRYLEGYFDFPALLRRDDAELGRYFGELRRYYESAAGLEVTSRVASNDGDAGGFMVIALYLGLGRHHDWAAHLGRVRAPVLVIHGSEDLQPRAASERVARAIPGARVAVIEGAGHFPHEERPEAFAAVVKAFLSERSR